MLEQDTNRFLPQERTSPREWSAPQSRSMSNSELMWVAENELQETESSRKIALKELREWVIAQETKLSCTRDISDEFLLRFLRVQKFDVKKAAVVLDNYIQFRSNCPNWFDELDIRVTFQL